MLTIFKKQLANVIEWKDQDINQIWFKFPTVTDEIKNASTLILTSGQGCVLVYEGKIINVIEQEGNYNLKTDNHPFITTLLNLRQSFESQHKLYLYFFKKTEILNQNWGTASPIKYVDPVYKFPIELGVNGNFSYRINDINQFFSNVVGSKNSFFTTDAKQIIVNRFLQQMVTIFAQEKISYQEIDAKLKFISDALFSSLNIELTTLGFALTDFKISGTTFNKETSDRIAKVSDITADVRGAEQGGLNYVDMEKLKALRDAAKNEGGLAGAGLQVGVGLELGKDMASQSTTKTDETDYMATLQKLKMLLNDDIITQEEFDIKKKEILSKI